jgi:hypothetical protein
MRSKDSKSSLPNKIAARRSLFPEEENRQSRRQHIGAAEICQEQTHRIHGGTIAVPLGLSGKMKIGINQEWQAVQDPANLPIFVCIWNFIRPLSAVISAGTYAHWQNSRSYRSLKLATAHIPSTREHIEADRIHSLASTSQAPRGSPQPMCYPSAPPSAVVPLEFRRRRAPPFWPRSSKSRILSSGRHRHRREYSCFACAFAYRSPLNSGAYPETLCKG